jgi:hypothetical protein
MEQEPWWINRFKRIQQRMNEQPLTAAPRDEVTPVPLEGN